MGAPRHSASYGRLRNVSRLGALLMMSVVVVRAPSRTRRRPLLKKEPKRSERPSRLLYRSSSLGNAAHLGSFAARSAEYASFRAAGGHQDTGGAKPIVLIHRQ